MECNAQGRVTCGNAGGAEAEVCALTVAAGQQESSSSSSKTHSANLTVMSCCCCCLLSTLISAAAQLDKASEICVLLCALSAAAAAVNAAHITHAFVFQLRIAIAVDVTPTSRSAALRMTVV